MKIIRFSFIFILFSLIVNGETLPDARVALKQSIANGEKQLSICRTDQHKKVVAGVKKAIGMGDCTYTSSEFYCLPSSTESSSDEVKAFLRKKGYTVVDQLGGSIFTVLWCGKK